MTPQLMSNLFSYSAMENLRRPYCLKIQTTLIEKNSSLWGTIGHIWSIITTLLWTNWFRWKNYSFVQFCSNINPISYRGAESAYGSEIPYILKFGAFWGIGAFWLLALCKYKVKRTSFFKIGPSCAEWGQLCQQLIATYILKYFNFA